MQSSVRLDGDRQWTAIFRSHQRLFDWVEVRVLAGPLEDIHRVVPKPLQPCLVCLLTAIVLLEGEFSAQSEVLSTRFSLRVSLYFALFSFSSTLASHPIPAAEKHPHSMILQPPCFTVGMVLGS